MVPIDQIMAYEQGQQEYKDTIAMFQAMIDDGSVWHLQGHYGRTAARLIESGECRPAPSGRPLF